MQGRDLSHLSRKDLLAPRDCRGAATTKVEGSATEKAKTGADRDVTSSQKFSSAPSATTPSRRDRKTECRPRRSVPTTGGRASYLSAAVTLSAHLASDLGRCRRAAVMPRIDGAASATRVAVTPPPLPSPAVDEGGRVESGNANVNLVALVGIVADAEAAEVELLLGFEAPEEAGVYVHLRREPAAHRGADGRGWWVDGRCGSQGALRVERGARHLERGHDRKGGHRTLVGGRRWLARGESWSERLLRCDGWRRRRAPVT